MTNEEVLLGEFRDHFYRDGFALLVSSFAILLISVSIVLGLSLWTFFNKPKPQFFMTDDSWRVVPSVPVNEAYISTPALLQWVSDVLPGSLTVDFVNWQSEVAGQEQHFTPDGWKKYQQILQVYASESSVEKYRLFVSAVARGAPVIVNQGLYQGSYGWWIQMPVDLSYSSSVKGNTKSLVIQALVIRVPTLDDLRGVRINNIIVKAGEVNQGVANE